MDRAIRSALQRIQKRKPGSWPGFQPMRPEEYIRPRHIELERLLQLIVNEL